MIRLAIYAVMLGYLGVVVYPMFWLLYTSLKTDREIFLDPFSLPSILSGSVSTLLSSPPM